MPADASEQIRQLPSGKWQFRYYDRKGVRHSGGAFASKSAARAHYRDVIEPGLNGKPVARRDLTYTDLVEVFLERHAIVAKPTDDHGASVEAQAVRGQCSGRCRSPSWRTCPTRSPRARTTLPERLRVRDHAGVPAVLRSRRPLRLHDPEPREARRPEPDAETTRDPRSTPPTEIDGDRRGAGTGRGGRCDVRGRDRTHDPRSGRRSSAETSTRPARVLLVRGTKTIRSTARGSAHQDGARRARPGAATAGLAATCSARRVVSRATGEPGPFDVHNFRSRALGAGDRSRRDREAREALRPPARRSRRTRSPPGSRCSSWPGSWARRCR